MANRAADEAAHDFRQDAADPRHGTRHGYTYYGCKCVPCHTANAEYQKRRDITHPRRYRTRGKAQG